MRNTLFLSAALIVAGAAAAAAQTPAGKVQACALLTSGDVAAVGGTGRGQENKIVITAGAAKGQTMHMCTWAMGTKGSVSVSVVHMPAGAKGGADLAQINPGVQRLKAQGWQTERKDFGDIMCAVFTPPPAQKGLPISTGCFTASKGMGISVGANSTARVGVEEVKVLLDKAIARLR